MLTKDKVAEIFVMADEFCKVFDAVLRRRKLIASKQGKKRAYHRANRMSDAEMITILIIFHMSNHKCFKYFYLNEVCVNMRHLFPKVVSYNRFTELEKSVVVQFVIFVKKCLLGKCTGISFVDSTLLRKRAIIETIYDELKNIAQIEHTRHRSFPNFIANLIGGIAAYCFFPKKPMINLQRVYDNQLTLF